jgi:glucokinase
MEHYVVGIDLGGSKIAAALAAADGRILAQQRCATPVNGGAAAVLAAVAALVRRLLAEHGLAEADLGAAGLGVPGMVERESGLCRFSPNLFWHDVDIAGFWREHFACPLALDNDVRLGALAEQRWGAGRGARDLIFVALGTGIGSGLILGGEIYRGSRGLAGEFGHITVTRDGPRCNCGNRGCLEVYAAGPAIARRAREGMERAPESLLWRLAGGDTKKVTAELVSQAADQGDELARWLWEETGEYLGIGLATAATLLNPERIVLGGGVAQAGEKLLRPLKRTLAARTMTASGVTYPVVPAVLGSAAGVRGAVAAALKLCDRRGEGHGPGIPGTH